MKYQALFPLKNNDVNKKKKKIKMSFDCFSDKM